MNRPYAPGEDPLRQAEELNRRIVESTGDCVKILSRDGNLLYVNSEGLRTLEIADVSAILNCPLAGFFEGDMRRAAEQALDQARQGHRGRFQYMLRTASGVPKWFDSVVTPITNAQGDVVQLLAISRDITERRRDEGFRAAQHHVLEMIATGRALPEVLDSLVRMIESQAEGMFCTVLLLDEDGVTVRHGAAPSLPKAYLQGIDGLCIGPRTGSCGTAMFRGERVIVADIETDPLWEDYREVVRPFGLRACWSTPIFSPDRKVLGSLAMYFKEPRAPGDDELRLVETAADIARIAIEQQRAYEDRQRAETEADAHRRQLAHLNRVAMLGELSGAIAHELSQPLAAVLSNAYAARYLLDQTPLDTGELRAAIDDVIRNDKRAGAVIDRLRALLKKGGTAGPQRIDVNDIVSDVLDLARGELTSHRVNVQSALATAIPPVQGDRVQLQQVVLNLVLNACDAMHDTPATERCLVLSTSALNGFVQMMVSDRGGGIPADQLEHVFEPFVTFRQQGLGLGLAISRSIVAAHGGSIRAENNPAGGAIFRCLLPVASA